MSLVNPLISVVESIDEYDWDQWGFIYCYQFKKKKMKDDEDDGSMDRWWIDEIDDGLDDGLDDYEFGGCFFWWIFGYQNGSSTCFMWVRWIPRGQKWWILFWKPPSDLSDLVKLVS